MFEFIPTVCSSKVSLFNGNIELASRVEQGYFGSRRKEEIEKYKYIYTSVQELDVYNITLSRSDFGWTENTPIKLRIKNKEVSWKASANYTSYLHIGYMGDEFGWLMP